MRLVLCFILGLAQAANGENNEAVILSAVSTNREQMVIGANGTNNFLLVERGANLISTSGVIGTGAGARNNHGWITDPGSVWQISGHLGVGTINGVENEMFVLNGGAIISGSGIVGGLPGSRGNRVMIAGRSSSWTVSGEVFVGFHAPGSEVRITDGALLSTDLAAIGFAHEGDSNRIVVSGLGSRWTNARSVSVGGDGSHNELLILDGAVIDTENVWLSIGYGGSSNRVAVADQGSTLNIRNALRISTFWNEARISNGATLNAKLVAVDGSSNHVFISEQSSVHATGQFVIQTFYEHGTNSLSIEEGGALTVGTPASGGTVLLDRAIVRLKNGKITADQITLSNTHLSGTGILVGNVTNRGLISLQSANGPLVISGQLDTSGQLDFELGPVASSAALLRVEGPILLKGSLAIKLSNSAPDASQQFVLVSAHEIRGEFTNALNRARVFTSPGSFRIEYTSTSVVATDFRLDLDPGSVPRLIPIRLPDRKRAIDFPYSTGKVYSTWVASSLPSRWTRMQTPTIVFSSSGTARWFIDDAQDSAFYKVSVD